MSPDAAFSPPPPQIEPTERWIRVRLGRHLLADSRRALLLVRYGPRHLPTYYLPLDDVAEGALTNPVEDDDGTVRWTVRAGRRAVVGGATTHARSEPGMEPLAGHVTFDWETLDWFEEEEQVFVHARDPSKRVDVLTGSRHVRVELDGVLLAESTRPMLLFETTLPTRFYLPPEDVRTQLLEPSGTVTRCPYKGTARFWSARVADRLEPDLAWSYPEPIRENPRIRGLICFYNERVDLTVDGELLARPVTPWSVPGR
ncbi:MAG TPA: DUF427 domain-containing protein [Jiangellales bacterium]|nr:DUF427 domain-containing protein [Jiangellales bacterium]